MPRKRFLCTEVGLLDLLEEQVSPATPTLRATADRARSVRRRRFEHGDLAKTTNQHLATREAAITEVVGVATARPHSDGPDSLSVLLQSRTI
jgi:hypothetical protein